MLYRDESFVPPSCPALEVGQAADIENMEFAHDLLPVDEAGVPSIEIAWQFFKRDDPDDAHWTTVSTYAVWPSETTPGKQAEELMRESQKEFIDERIRTLLCERVAECRGIVGNECWALGETALKDIHGQVLTELESE